MRLIFNENISPSCRIARVDALGGHELSASAHSDRGSQKPHPPIHVGGAYPHGARRAIRYGDGWIPGGDIHEVLPKFREMARDAGRDPASIEITSFALGEDFDRVKCLAEMGVARVVPMFPPEKPDTVLPVVDRWTKIMRQVNG
jgi:alkanesulfonate monooxygenase SsuD/methylene tetrahydromethanopterin reductase-like flavin-dependent oxidoreductase (luciferase family)